MTLPEESMKKIDDGGPAFPVMWDYAENETGMSLRDWFAGECHPSEIDAMMPTTCGEMRDLMIREGIIPASRRNNSYAPDSYNESDKIRLRIKLRWNYADAMIRARAPSQDGGNHE